MVLLVGHYLDNVFLGKFACKRVPVGNNHEWLERVLMEVSLLQNLSHQNLVSYRHVWLEDFQASAFLPSTPHVFILQQYCNSGTLLDYVLGPRIHPESSKEQLKHHVRNFSRRGSSTGVDSQKGRRMHFDEIFSFFRDIAAGLGHLHANGYVHRDLKPQNCLLHHTEGATTVLVSDFGEMVGAGADRGPNSTGYTGTIAFAAPEVLQRDQNGRLGNFTDKSDVFSLGQITYFMCFNRLPYRSADLEEEKEDLSQLKDEIVAWTGLGDERKERSDLPDRLYKFLTLLLSYDPSERPSTEEILRATKAGSGFSEYTTSTMKTDEFEIPKDPSQPSSPIEGPTMKWRGVKPGWAKSNRRSSTDASRPTTSFPGPRKVPSKPASPEPGGRGSEMILHDDENSQWLETRKTPPLLMAPPRPTFLQSARRVLNQREVIIAFKLAVFTAKIWSATWPCSPLAPRPQVAYPLLVFAAADLIGLTGPAAALGLAVLHAAVLLPTWHAGRLCC